MSDSLAIEILELDEVELARLDLGMTNVTGGCRGYRFTPHGTRFKKNLKLSLTFDPALLPPGMTDQDVHAFYFDDSQGRWVALPRIAIDHGKRRVISATDHFTDIIAATITVPSHPEVSGYAPTTLKDLKAADPAQGIKLVEPPQANAMGDVRLSYPIEIPPGRNGAQPSVALNYSSSGGNGWVGMGWTVPVSEIVVDTRWGVPRYGMLMDASGSLRYQDVETESYVLNGEQLTPLAHRGVTFEARNGEVKVFHTRVEGAFQKVVRHGTCPGNFWWEVYDKNGTRSTYGDPPGSSGTAVLRDGPPPLSIDCPDPTTVEATDSRTSGVPGTGQNIFRWALRETRDINGNVVLYNYDLAVAPGVSAPGQASVAEAGYQLYLRSINYTARASGAAATEGAYDVIFIRRGPRIDTQVDARGGFKMVTADYLERVDVTFLDELVRSYELRYESGSAGKLRLVCITQKGLNGAPFPGNTHRFKYDDQVGFDPSRATWNVPNDNLSLCSDIEGVVGFSPCNLTEAVPSCLDPFSSDPLSQMESRPSVISGALTTSLSGHAYIGVGLCSASKYVSIGGKLGFTYGETDVRTGLFDIDGDNLPDKVFKRGDGLFFHKNLSGPAGQSGFDLGTPSTVTGYSDLSRETAVTTSGGAEAYAYGGTAVYNTASTTTIGTAYSTDANGDGLLDVVSGGSVLFGRREADGQISFDANSSGTPVPVYGGVIDPQGLLPESELESVFRTLLARNPLHDVVRRWVAPFEGHVRVTGPVRLATPCLTRDGVRVSVQLGQNEPLWSEMILPGHSEETVPSGLDDIAVQAGEPLYFRAQSIFEGSDDGVSWNPVVEYLDRPAITDVNLVNPYRYEAAADFVLAGRDTWIKVPYTGDVRVTGILHKAGQTSDSVFVQVVRNDAVVQERAIGWEETGDVVVDAAFHVTKDDGVADNGNDADSIQVRLRIDSPVDLSRLTWLPDHLPRIAYESAEGFATALDQLGNPMIRLYPITDIDLYPIDEPQAPQQQTWTAPCAGRIRITPRLGGDWAFHDPHEENVNRENGTLTFTVKRANQLIAKTALQVVHFGVLNAALEEFDVLEGQTFYFDVSARNLEYLGSLLAEVLYTDMLCDSVACDIGGFCSKQECQECEPLLGRPITVRPALHRNFRRDEYAVQTGNGLFAIPYRGWGFVGYNGNHHGSDEQPAVCPSTQPCPPNYSPPKPGEPCISPVLAAPCRQPSTTRLEGDFKLDKNELNRVKDMTPEERDTYASQQRVYPFVPVCIEDPATGTVVCTWRGPDVDGWIGAEELHASRLGINFITVPCEHDLAGGNGSTTPAVPRISTGHNKGFSVGVAGASYGATISSGTRADLDYMDLNGDRFPDVIGNGLAQFTLPSGALERSNRPLLEGTHRSSTNEAKSFGYSGSVPFAVGGSKATNGPNNGSIPKGETTKNSMPPFGFGITASISVDSSGSNVDLDLIDINGDGLPDRVDRNSGTVAFNLGYRFAAPESWSEVVINRSLNHDCPISPNLGFNDLIYGFAGGLSFNRAESRTIASLMDMNGDGLVDRVRIRDGALYVAFNAGRQFLGEQLWSGGEVDYIASAATSSMSAGGYVSIPIWIPFTCLFVIINPGLDASASFNRQERAILDLDGDGYPDYLRSDGDDRLSVHRNLTGTTNLLTEVWRPLGGRIAIEYGREGNTYEQPESRWVMQKVTVDDGHLDDGPNLVTTFAYSGGRYDRLEREFYGFESVVETHRDAGSGEAAYRAITRRFKNADYYTKALLASELTSDDAGRPFIEKRQNYAVRDVSTGAEAPDVNGLVGHDALFTQTATVFPMLTKTETFYHEGQAGAGKRTHTEQTYDEFGNVELYRDIADDGPEDDVEAQIEYWRCSDKYLVAEPSHIQVRGNGTVMRERFADLDCNTGNVLRIRERLLNGSEAVTDLSYTEDGNLLQVVGPQNQQGERYTVNYLYDPTVATHVTKVTDSFQLTSATTYDLRFGLPLKTTDSNQQGVTLVYDAFGRTSTVTGPYEVGAATVSFSYHADQSPPWALTRRQDTFRNALDPIETVLFVDGMGRAIQTKVDGTVHKGVNAAPEDVMIVSGRVGFDFLGRTVAQEYPRTEALGSQGAFNSAPDPDGVLATTTTYDILDRITSTRRPDGTTTSYSYDFGSAGGGVTWLRTTVTDPKGHQKLLHHDTRQLLIAIREGTASSIWTRYSYDAMGQLKTIVDDRGNETRYQYDNLGRRVALQRPDAGRTEFDYDLASNLVALRTANLSSSGKQISYRYSFERLLEITYPEFPDRGVTYTYGGAGAPYNQAGRVARITDQSGSVERQYGRLGEVVFETRRVDGQTEGSGPSSPEVYTTQFLYDTWGRLQKLTYPDNEVLTYSYDSGGLVRAAHGAKSGNSYAYLDRLEYDKFQQRVFLKVGNGVESQFTYRPDNRRMQTIDTRSAIRAIQRLHYTYDPVGNVESILNDVPVPTGADFGGPARQSFGYDDLDRLTTASGSYEYAPGKRDEYSLALHYDTIHNILAKTQLHEVVQPSGSRTRQHKTSYDIVYEYGSAKPHAATHIGDRGFTYDLNGNQAGWSHDQNGTLRNIVWDEDNHVRSIFDQGHEKSFKYDDSGERILKRGPQGETAYINQYFTVRNREAVTKHIYVGSTRLASKLGKQPRPGSGSSAAPTEDMLYFFHSDRLANTQFVTDGTGRVFQHQEYFPFGENWVNEASNTQRAPYSFGGKEFDEETGLYYYGARYYDPRANIWQSVDPSFHKYAPDGNAPVRMDMASLENDWMANFALAGVGGVFNSLNLAEYGFSHLNPVRYTDSDGSETQVIISKDKFLGWEYGSHAAVRVDNPLGKATLYDPSGDYPGNSRNRAEHGSDATFEGQEANLDSYVKYHLGALRNSSVEIYTFDTTPEQERDIAKRADELRDPRGLNCAEFTSGAISEIGPFKGLPVVKRPGALGEKLGELGPKQQRTGIQP